MKYFFSLLFFFIFITTELFSDWIPINSGTGSNINQLRLNSQNQLWMTGNNSLLKYTADNGQTFNSIELPCLFNIYSAYFLSDTSIFIAGDNKKFYTTQNGGLTWTDKSNNITLSDTEIITSVFFINTETGWITTASGKILKTANSGQTFTLQFSNLKKFNKIWFKNIEQGVAIGDGIFLESTNSGKNWNIKNLTQNINYLDYYETICLSVITGGNGYIIKSYNNWLTDTFVQLDGVDSIYSISFCDTNNFVIGCNNGQIFISEDTLTTFQQMNSATAYDILSVIYKNINEIWAAGKYGLLLNYRRGFSIYQIQPGVDYPVANAGTDILTLPYTTITLDASKTSDPDTYFLKYYWEQIAGPPVNINKPDSVTPRVTLFNEGHYAFRVRATNKEHKINFDVVDVFAINNSYDTVSDGTLLILNPDIIADTFLKKINIINAQPQKIRIPVYNSLASAFSEYYEIEFNPSESNLKLLIYNYNGDLKKGINYLADFDKFQYTILGIKLFDINNNDRSKTLDILDFPGKFKFSYKLDNTVYNTTTAASLKIYYFDEFQNSWFPLSTILNSATYTLTSETQYLYTIAVFSEPTYNKPSSTLNNVIIYPNPFKPNDNNIYNGIDYNGQPGTGIYIKGVKPNCSIEIADLSGKKIFSTICNGNHYQWNCRNDDNEYVPSGLYFVKISSNNETIIKKLLIVR